MEALDLNKIVRRIMEFVQPDITAHEIEVQLELDDALNIKGDEDQLYRALLNIIMNSIQAMEEGGKLVIRSRLAGARAVLEISDNGCGMDEEVRNQVFQAFYTTKSRGTGLGLAIVKNILDRHQAEINITSAAGEGTTFVISFKSFLA
jgi:signal transduction histidine kinase